MDDGTESWEIYRDVLVALMRSQGATPSLLARAAGVSPALIGHMRQGTRTTFQRDSVAAVAGALGVAPRILGCQARTPIERLSPPRVRPGCADNPWAMRPQRVTAC